MVRSNKHEYLFIIAIVCGAACCSANGQGLGNAFDGIVRVETSGGRGTGFVVAATEGEFEIWTNAHVAGKTKSHVTIRTGTGTIAEKTFPGIVAWSRYGEGFDAAKVICSGSYDGPVFSVSDGGGSRDLSVTGGHPKGGRAYAIRVNADQRNDFGNVVAYLPASIGGQSGSPIVGADGRVVGVVTLRLGTGRNAVGGMLPIRQWATPSQDNVSFKGFGDFELLPLAREPP